MSRHARIGFRARVRWIVLSLLGSLSACSLQPIGRSAQAGSTVVLAIAGEVDAGASLGFGSDWLSDAGQTDAQRGELVFVLCGEDGAEFPLRTKFTTRAWPDPASDAALRGRVVDGPLGAAGLAQALAIVEIPDDVPPADYRLEIRRRRALPGGASEALPGIPYAQPLRVLPAQVDGFVGRATPPAGIHAGFSVDLVPPLAALVPHPKVVLALDAPASAAHLEVDYPAQKIHLLGVIEEQHSGRSSVVAFRDDPSAGRVGIDLVAPESDVDALALVFELRDPDRTGSAVTGEFQVAAATLYDASGAPRAGAARVAQIR